MKKNLILIILIATFTIKNVSAVTNYNQIVNSDFLTTQGSKIVKKSNGQTVVLQGLNIGGWLFQTKAMSPINMTGISDFSMLDVYDVLSKRGLDADSLFNVYYKNFITEYDLDEIAKTGANVVRIPFWWRNLLNENGTYKLDRNGNIDFTYFDWIVEECGKRGIYVIFSLHAAHGGQSPTSHAAASRNASGQYEAQLFLKNEVGQNYRKQTVELWKNIARHFNNNPIVAGYDILNEPWDDSNSSSISYRHNDLYEFYNWIYKEIRNVDQNHIIFMESSWKMDELIQYGKKRAWKYIVYSPHDYPIHSEDKQNEQNLHNYFTTTINSHKNLMSQYNVPIYVGELTCYGFWNQCSYAFNLYKNANISYTPWSYKVNARDSYFGVLYRTFGLAEKANMTSDSYNKIKQILGYRTKQKYVVNLVAREVLMNQFGGRIVKQVLLNMNDLNLKIGDKVTLNATVVPNYAINKDIIWVSSDNNIATVDSNGVVTAKNIGTVYIVAKAKENLEIKASCKVTIQGTPVTNVPVSGITLSKKELELTVDATHKMDANILPSNATNKGIVWVSSNNSIATVDSNGVVTAKNIGTVYIVAKAKENLEIKANCKVTIREKSTADVPVSNIILSENKLELIVNTTYKIDANVLPSNATNKDLIYNSSDPSIVSVDNMGNLLAKKVGVATILVKSKQNENIVASSQVTVTTKENHKIAVDYITLNFQNITFKVGETKTIMASVYPDNASNKKIAWTSDNPNVVSITDGKMVAQSEGVAYITASSKENPNIKASCKVLVTNDKETERIVSISINNPQLELYESTTIQIGITTLPAFTANETISWESSNNDIVTVNQDGVLTAIKEGTAKIKVKYLLDSDIFAECEVTIIKKPETKVAGKSIKLYNYYTTIYTGEDLQLTAVIFPSDATDKSIIWESNNIDIATVDSNGVVTAKKSGVVTITAKLKENPLIEAKCEIIVDESIKQPTTNNREIYLTIAVGTIIILVLVFLLLKWKPFIKKNNQQ